MEKKRSNHDDVQFGDSLIEIFDLIGWVTTVVGLVITVIALFRIYVGFMESQIGDGKYWTAFDISTPLCVGLITLALGLVIYSKIHNLMKQIKTLKSNDEKAQ
jgi:hypothetical protein